MHASQRCFTKSQDAVVPFIAEMLVRYAALIPFLWMRCPPPLDLSEPFLARLGVIVVDAKNVVRDWVAEPIRVFQFAPVLVDEYAAVEKGTMDSYLPNQFWPDDTLYMLVYYGCSRCCHRKALTNWKIPFLFFSGEAKHPPIHSNPTKIAITTESFRNRIPLHRQEKLIRIDECHPFCFVAKSIESVPISRDLRAQVGFMR